MQHIKEQKSPLGSAIYPFIEQPSTKFNAAGDYSVKLRLDGEDAKAFKATVDAWCEQSYQEAIKNETNPAKKKNKKRQNPPYEEVFDDAGNETGAIDFKFKALHSGTRKKDGSPWKFTLPIYDRKGQQIQKRIGIGGGSTIRVYFTATLYDVSSTGCGVKLKMDAVQLVELVKFGQANIVVEEEESGYDYNPDDALEDTTPATETADTNTEVNADAASDF